MRAERRQRGLAGEGRREAVGDRDRLHGHRSAGRQALVDRARPFRLDADHTPTLARRRRRDPGDQPAAPAGDEDRLDLRRVLEQLQPHGARAGDHDRVVERMDERAAGRRDHLRQPLERARGVDGLEVDGGAVAPRRGDLRLARALPHHDEGVEALRSRAPGQCGRVVPGRDPDHAALPLGRRQRCKPVEHAADLEAPGALQQLRLEPDVRPERRGGQRRRAVEPATDPLGCRLDVGTPDHRRLRRSHRSDRTSPAHVLRPGPDNRPRWTTIRSASSSRTTSTARA